MTTSEQAVDFAAIRVGDKVKLRYHGLESTDWHEVVKLDAAGGLHVGTVASVDWYVAEGGEVAVIAHQPAPRTVEVTLGEPLTSADRFYAASVAARRGSSPGVYIGVLGLLSYLTPSDARRLVRDILATVGIEDD